MCRHNNFQCFDKFETKKRKIGANEEISKAKKNNDKVGTTLDIATAFLRFHSRRNKFKVLAS